MGKIQMKKQFPSVRRSTVAAYKRATRRQLYKALRMSVFQPNRLELVKAINQARKLPVRKYQLYFEQMLAVDEL